MLQCPKKQVQVERRIDMKYPKIETAVDTSPFPCKMKINPTPPPNIAPKQSLSKKKLPEMQKLIISTSVISNSFPTKVQSGPFKLLTSSKVQKVDLIY